MYRKILIPTDGSPVAECAARAGMTFAAEVGAAVVGFSAAPPYRYPMDLSGQPHVWPNSDEYAATMASTLQWDLRVVRDPAEAAGLPFEPVTVLSDHPAEEIVAAASRLHCDLIFMGSHGRSGLKRLLLGSVAAQVLSLCEIPVTIYRPSEDEVVQLRSESALQSMVAT